MECEASTDDEGMVNETDMVGTSRRGERSIV
jgi:hypothetical protein